MSLTSTGVCLSVTVKVRIEMCPQKDLDQGLLLNRSVVTHPEVAVQACVAAEILGNPEVKS